MTDIVDDAQRREEAQRADSLEAVALTVAALSKPRSNSLCLDCADPIEAERLAVLPGALRCLTCEEAHERRGRFVCRT